jgi:hypothetical protein
MRVKKFRLSRVTGDEVEHFCPIGPVGVRHDMVCVAEFGIGDDKETNTALFEGSKPTCND